MSKLEPEQRPRFSPNFEEKRHFEDFNLEEIYDFISELNKTVSLDTNNIFKKDKKVFPDSNNNTNLNDIYVNKELSKLFKRKRIFKSFKCPQKVSLIGKVFVNDKN